tara:strand:+ start:429 stop:578 length:150 start_codon:yes stop_codon:yes gene_type:complete
VDEAIDKGELDLVVFDDDVDSGLRWLKSQQPSPMVEAMAKVIQAGFARL